MYQSDYEQKALPIICDNKLLSFLQSTHHESFRAIPHRRHSSEIEVCGFGRISSWFPGWMITFWKYNGRSSHEAQIRLGKPTMFLCCSLVSGNLINLENIASVENLWRTTTMRFKHFALLQSSPPLAVVIDYPSSAGAMSCWLQVVTLLWLA